MPQDNTSCRVRKGRVTRLELTLYLVATFLDTTQYVYKHVSVDGGILGYEFNDRQRGTTHQPGPSKSHEPRHEGDSSTTTLRELFVPFALLAQLAPSSSRYAPSQTMTLSW